MVFKMPMLVLLTAAFTLHGGGVPSSSLFLGYVLSVAHVAADLERRDTVS